MTLPNVTDVQIPVQTPTTLREQTRAVARVLRSDSHVLPLLVAAALFSECHQTILTFLNQLQYVRCAIPTAAMGYLYILMTVIGLLAARSHKLTARLGEPRSMTLLLLAGCAACLLLTLTANAVLSVLGLAVLNAAFSLFNPILLTIENRRITGGNRASILSVYAILIDCVAVGTSLTFGWAADSGVANAMLLGAGFCFAALGLYGYWAHTEGEKKYDSRGNKG